MMTPLEQKMLEEATARHESDKVSLRVELKAAHAEIERLNSALESAVAKVSDLATKLGQAEGKLLMSEAVGVVDGWRDRCRTLEDALWEIVETDRVYGVTFGSGEREVWHDGESGTIARAALASGGRG